MTVGVNISQDSSICIKTEESIKFFEESRFSKKKHWSPSYTDFDYKSVKKIKNFNDFFIFTSWGRDFFGNQNKDIHEDEFIIKGLCKKYNIKNYFFNRNEHHMYHAVAGFYLAPFNEALCITIDGGGAFPYPEHCPFFPHPEIYREVDSVYLINNLNVKPLYKKYSCGKSSTLNKNSENKVKLKTIIKSFKDKTFESHLYNSSFKHKTCNYTISSSYNPGLLFNHLCSAIGTISVIKKNSYIEENAESGKAMGLSSYGNSDGMRDEDLAKQVQEVTEEYTIDLIERALVSANCKNIVLSGGYFLNCVNNYKYTQYFKNINFFVDPCPHDGGTALGAALWYDNYK